MTPLLCEWNKNSDDAKHDGIERCTDCLVEGSLSGVAEDCQALDIDAHCSTCDCRPERLHDEGFVSCDKHLFLLMERYVTAPATVHSEVDP